MNGANRQDAAGVGPALSAEEIGEMLSGVQVACRAAPFPTAPNGAPKPCSTVRGGRVRGEMQREGGSPHWEGIFALTLCDIQDGVTDERARAVFLRALALVDDALARRRASRPASDYMRPLGATVTAARKAEHRLELAELRAVDSKASVGALESVLAEVDRCIAQESAMREDVERTLILERGAPRHTVGRRTGALSLA